MKQIAYCLSLVIISIILAYADPVYAAPTANITWTNPAPYNEQQNPQGFLPGGNIEFTGSVTISGCGNNARDITLTFFIKDKDGNWQNVGSLPTQDTRSNPNYSKTIAIPSSNQNTGLTDIKIDYTATSNQGTTTGDITKTSHIFMGLCPLNTSGNVSISSDCAVEKTLKLTNGNLTIQNATIQINSNSTFIFKNGYNITIGTNGYILKSASGSKILKEN